MWSRRPLAGQVRVFGIQKCRKVKENPGEWSQVKRVRWKSRLHQDILSPPSAPPLSKRGNRENEGGIGVVKGRGQRGKKKKNNISPGNGSQASPWSKDTKSLPRGGRRNNLVSVYVLARRFCCCWDDGLDGFTCRDRNEAVGGFLWVLDFSVDQSDCVISCLPFSREGKPPSRKRASGFCCCCCRRCLGCFFYTKPKGRRR